MLQIRLSKKFWITIFSIFIFLILQEITKYEANPNLIQEIIFEGSERARIVAKTTMEEVRDAMGITY